MGLEALYLLIPASLILAGIALALFLWAIHSGQFDDLETPAIRAVFDDGTRPPRDGSPQPAPEGTPPARGAGPHPERPHKKGHE